jgi:hypothetical protein
VAGRARRGAKAAGGKEEDIGKQETDIRKERMNSLAACGRPKLAGATH